jgi:threonine dehydratase
VASIRRDHPEVKGVITATRGNHGQSVALAARGAGLEAQIVVPRGNSPDKNAAMRAFGARLIEHGEDFDAALEHARLLAERESLYFFPSFHADLIRGVSSYALELLRSAPPLDTVYVPIGLGSGICGMIAARDALGLRTRIVGVVSERADAYARSFAERRPVATDSADTLADGLAVRVPDPDALAVIWRSVERVVTVSDAQIIEAMRHYFACTHNIAEGAGAAPLAALLAERVANAGKRVGVVLSGGNVDRELYLRALG